MWQVEPRPSVQRLVEEMLASGKYDDLNDLIEKAVLDRYDHDSGGPGRVPQRTVPLAADGSPKKYGPKPEPSEQLHQPLLAPVDVSADDVAEPPAPEEFRALPFLMNRMNPVAYVTRVVGNMSRCPLGEVADAVGSVGRSVGQRLQELDDVHRAKGSRRQAVSWPVGEDAERSAAKFVDSYFMTSARDGGLIDLGLARVVNDHLVLTQLGRWVAASPLPLLGESEVEGGTAALGTEARDALSDALLGNPAEVREMAYLFEAVGRSEGPQGDIDEVLRAVHDEWSEGMVASNRAAMVGRLRDLGVLEVEGRGPRARVQVTASGRPFAEKVLAA